MQTCIEKFERRSSNPRKRKDVKTRNGGMILQRTEGKNIRAGEEDAQRAWAVTMEMTRGKRGLTKGGRRGAWVSPGAGSPPADDLKRRCDYPGPIDIRSSQPRLRDASRRQRGHFPEFSFSNQRWKHFARINFYP